MVVLAVPAFAGESVVNRALAFLGVPYRFGGQSERGMDCAGFVRRSFAAAGVLLPRQSAQQYKVGCVVTRDELAPGDLVFFRNTYKKGISHVGIYVGDGLFVHAASTYRKVVVERLDRPYYSKRFAGGRRVNVPEFEACDLKPPVVAGAAE